MKRKKGNKKNTDPSWVTGEDIKVIDEKKEKKLTDKKLKKKATFEVVSEIFMDRALLRPGYNNHPDDWVDLANKMNDLEALIRKWPGLTRFELAREGSCKNEFEFQQAISILKFSGEIYEDEKGFFFMRKKY